MGTSFTLGLSTTADPEETHAAPYGTYVQGHPADWGGNANTEVNPSNLRTPSKLSTRNEGQGPQGPRGPKVLA